MNHEQPKGKGANGTDREYIDMLIRGAEKLAAGKQLGMSSDETLKLLHRKSQGLF